MRISALLSSIVNLLRKALEAPIASSPCLGQEEEDIDTSRAAESVRPMVGSPTCSY